MREIHEIIGSISPRAKAMLAVKATSRLGSFSRAASELNVTQSAISHLVAQAEDFLNTQLFVRQAGPYS
ncbi:LysR family transcriptional regulator [Mesorhizobium sp. M0482]|uniref:LysR family transcriptional regulator n=1 Tax=Mesorhizobium sp. M0482 TaxID=2956948 RepID=UPI003336A4C2